MLQSSNIVCKLLLQECIVPDNQSLTNDLDDEIIWDSSRIFKREILTEYQKKCNEASFVLCREKPSLLFGKKGDLLEMAWEKVHNDGYVYKKCTSHSRKHGTGLNLDVNMPKHSKVNQTERQTQIKDVAGEIEDLDQRIAFKETLIQQATLVRNFRECDMISEELSDLKTRKR